LAEYKRTRPLHTNVEFYTALLLHGIEFPTSLFTPAFAAARVAGWTAHCLEQIASNRLFRPQSTYIGARNRAVESRHPVDETRPMYDRDR
jgi:citrate synthase